MYIPRLITSFQNVLSIRISLGFYSKRLGLQLAIIFVVLLPTRLTCQANTSAKIEKGIVINGITPGGQGEKAGLRTGDVLLSWQKSNGGWAEIQSPSDLPWIETERYGKPTKIMGLRGTIQHIWVLRSYGWDLSARPNMQGEVLRQYEEGRDLASAKNVNAAILRWRTTLEELQAYGPSWSAPWLLAKEAQWLFWDGQRDRGVRCYEAAIQGAVMAGPVVRADLLWKLASILESSGDLSGAAQRYEEVLSEWRKLGPQTVAVAASWVDLGRVAVKAGNLAKADEYFKNILDIQDELPHGNVQVTASYLNLGVLRESEGDLSGAERFYRKALAIELKRPLPDSRLAIIYTNLAALEYQRGNLQVSERYYQQALYVTRKAALGPQEEAAVLTELAECIAERGRPREAEILQRKAYAIRLKTAPNSLETASSLAGLGRIARILGNFENAKKDYELALSITDGIVPVPLELSGFLIGKGNVLRAQNNQKDAEACYRRALAIMEKLAPRSANHTDTLAALAETLRQQGELTEAVQFYQQALNELSQKAVHLGGLEEDHFQYRASHEALFENYADLLLQLGQPEKAFETIEASRARNLIEILARGHVDITRGVDSALLKHARNIQQLINAKSEYQIRLLQDKHSEEQANAVSTDIDRLWDEYQQVQAQIGIQSPEYTALTAPRAKTTPELQALLDQDTVLLEFNLNKEHSYLWTLTSTSLAVHQLPQRDEIEKNVRRAYQLLNARNRISYKRGGWQQDLAKADDEYQKLAEELSEMLLGSVATALKHQRLLIVGDGALQYFPFAALPVPNGSEINQSNSDQATGSKPAGFVPLLINHEILSLPSVSVLAELRDRQKTRKKPPKILAVFADPVFDTNDERVDRIRTGINTGPVALPTTQTRSALHSEPLSRALSDISENISLPLFLPRLPGSREEAEAIVALIPKGQGMKALDFQVNRSSMMDPALKQYRLVHIATHGLMNSKHPELSGLVLSLVDKGGKPQNGFLQLQDIYNMQLPVEMVVLSGCETALGKEISGEGLIGLTRGFMYAGAQRVIASLWSVSDKATAELMTKFYTAMEKEGLSPSAALRKAQIEMWRQRMWRAPYYWAAFQLQGDWN